MKPTILLIVLSMCITSCTSYQYLTVQGLDVKKTEDQGFVSENDTVKVSYNFSNYKGKIGITIFNKLNEPIEVDWKKSAIIVGNLSHSYYNPDASFSAQVQNDTLRRRNAYSSSVYVADIRGAITVNEAMSFIPPRASIYNENNYMPVQEVKGLEEKHQKMDTIRVQYAVSLPMKKYVFKEQESPIVFRSYLTLRIGQGANQKELALEHHFYISEIWNTTADPGYFPKNLLKAGDRFYLQP